MWLSFAKKKYTSVMIAFYIPKKIANKLSIKGGDSPRDLHLTICILGEAKEFESKKDIIYQVLKEFAAKNKPLSGKISGIGVFNGKTQPLYASFDSPDLVGFRANLLQSLNSIGVNHLDDHGYTPHITLDWYEPGEKIIANQVEPIDVKFNVLSVSWAGERKHFRLS